MANSYNSMPIILDTDTASGWVGLQTLNVGNLPSNAQQLSGAVARMPGVRPFRLQILSNGVTVAGVISVTDPKDSTILWQAAIAATAGATGTIIIDEAFDNTRLTWRDFKVTGLTATVTKMQIWYRQ